MPTSISRAVPKGCPAFEKSFGLTACIRSRALGPITHKTDSAAVTSVMTAKSSPRCWRIQARLRCDVAPGTTKRYAVSDNRVTVRSASIPPRGFNSMV